MKANGAVSGRKKIMDKLRITGNGKEFDTRILDADGNEIKGLAVEKFIISQNVNGEEHQPQCVLTLVPGSFEFDMQVEVNEIQKDILSEFANKLFLIQDSLHGKSLDNVQNEIYEVQRQLEIIVKNSHHKNVRMTGSLKEFKPMTINEKEFMKPEYNFVDECLGKSSKLANQDKKKDYDFSDLIKKAKEIEDNKSCEGVPYMDAKPSEGDGEATDFSHPRIDNDHARKLLEADKTVTIQNYPEAGSGMFKCVDCNEVYKATWKTASDHECSTFKIIANRCGHCSQLFEDCACDKDVKEWQPKSRGSGSSDVYTPEGKFRCATCAKLSDTEHEHITHDCKVEENPNPDTMKGTANEN